MAKISLKVPGAGAWSGSVPKSNRLLLVRHPSPPHNFYNIKLLTAFGVLIIFRTLPRPMVAKLSLK